MGVPIASGLPDYGPAGTINFNPELYSAKLVEKFYKTTVFGEIASTDELDGVTVDLGDGRWFNLRSSNTEPLLRVNVEGDTQEAMEVLRDDVLKVIGV